MSQFKLSKKLAVKVLEVVDAGLCSGLGTPIPGQMCVEAAVCYAMGLEHSDQPTCVSPVLRSLKISLNDKAWSSNKARAQGLRRLAILQLDTKDKLDEKEFVDRLVDLVTRKVVVSALVIASKLAVTEGHKKALTTAANKCKKEGTRESLNDATNAATNAAYAAAYAAYATDAAPDAAAAAYAAYAAAYAANAADAAASVATNAAAYAVNAANAAANAAASAAANAAAEDAKDQTLSEFAEDVVQILIDMKVPAVKYLNLLGK